MTLAPRPTLFITSPRLNRHVGLDVTLASETLQHTGSFKFRAAFNNAAQRKAAHLIATSSGNFGQALAYACQLHGKRCTVIMPQGNSDARNTPRAYRALSGPVDAHHPPRLSSAPGRARRPRAPSTTPATAAAAPAPSAHHECASSKSHHTRHATAIPDRMIEAVKRLRPLPPPFGGRPRGKSITEPPLLW